MVSVEAVYVPNRYTVGLSTTDHERFQGLIPELQKRFRGLLREAAQDRRWRLPGQLVVAFDQDESVKEGKFRVQAAHDSDAEALVDQVSAQLRLVGDSKDWTLDAERMVIGRQEACDIVVPDPNASRRHAEVAKRDDGWWIVDLESTNHTYVNGSLIKERKLQQGDRIRIGNTELEYRDSADGEE